MNKKIIIIIGVLVFALFFVSMFLLLRTPSTQPPMTTPGTNGTSTSTFPISTPGTGTNPNNTISIATENGGYVQTKDFLKDSATVENEITPGRYYLGNTFSDNAPYPPYVIEYIDETDFFNIGLFQEPIGQSRKEAEQYLIAHLGISQTQMCELRYSIGVPGIINEFYDSIELGFSFCPGSVEIPG